MLECLLIYFLRYDPKKTIKVYVGVNNKNIDKIEPYKHDVKEVIRPIFSSFQTDMDGICQMFYKNVIRANL